MLQRFFESALKAAGCEDFKLYVRIANDFILQQVNHAFRNSDKATDIVSIPYPGALVSGVGCVVVSLECDGNSGPKPAK